MASPDEKKRPRYFPPLTGDRVCVDPGVVYAWGWQFPERLTIGGVRGLYGPALVVKGLRVGCLELFPCPGVFAPDRAEFFFLPRAVERNEPVQLILENRSSEPLWVAPELVESLREFEGW